MYLYQPLKEVREFLLALRHHELLLFVNLLVLIEKSVWDYWKIHFLVFFLIIFVIFIIFVVNF